MKVLLAQNMLYVPALGGANKGNRELLEFLARAGHQCIAVTPGCSPAGPRTRDEFRRELSSRQIEVSSASETADVFRLNGVEVHALAVPQNLAAHVGMIARAEQPDCLIVGADDPGQSLLDAALSACPGRVVFLVRTTFYLPFGPCSLFSSRANSAQISRAAGIICNSPYVAEYVRKHLAVSGPASPPVVHLPLPSMMLGQGNHPPLGRFGQGAVTMVNPCGIKGISIFAELARLFPEVPFAAVPTWGTTSADRELLLGLPNIRLLPPADDINSILAQTQVLVVPSLWDEAFGRIVVEAMLCGIPVLASDVGGMREAKLGLPYVLPVNPIARYEEKFDELRLPVPVIPPQDAGPWAAALGELLAGQARYEKLAQESRDAALRFVQTLRPRDFEGALLEMISRAPRRDAGASPARAAASPAPAVATLSPEQRTGLALKALAARRGKNPARSAAGNALAPSSPARQPVSVPPPGAAPTQAAFAGPAGAASPALEKRIAEVWAGVLKRAPSGPGENFFDAGGHSLLAVRLLDRLGKMFGRELSLARFLENPNVAGLAALLGSEPAAAPSRSLTLLREGQGRPPLFLVHAHSGGVLGYAPLARRLPPEWPAYGLRSLALEDGSLEDPRIEDIASRYIREIRLLQPEGPYFLGGFCLGGVIAYEMARQLEEQGCAVAFLGLIQAVNREGFKPVAGAGRLARLFYRAATNFRYEFNVWFGLTPRETYLRFCDRFSRTRSYLKWKTGVLSGAQKVDGAQTEGQRRAALVQTYRNALNCYTPRGYEGPATVFRAKTQPWGKEIDPALGWERLARGRVISHIVPGHHSILMAEPNLAVLSRRLNDELEAAWQRAQPASVV